ncbi:PSD1 and planctomycete cytochrome C domain-containing protein [Stieleria varia]|uniref:PSD1 and planctomycete cytochrome C domain-containing protein n=1 Tax=Stieleria varia TaxID=2528005 RepID=UPI001E655024|nr:PSD1 and planctomycete cytochrome C domain-containing protein [Stieleria varia]
MIPCADALTLIADEVRFSRDVLPVLSDRCFHCHGPDEANREAGLRLDVEQAAKDDLGGYRAIVPGNSEASEIWQRITSTDPDVQMPPPDSHRKPLTPSERAAIRRWIDDGAIWGKHWSFEAPTRASLPDIAEHPVDAFVRQTLQDKGLTPSPPARSHTQIRRLSFDLLGLSPSIDDVHAFSNDPSDTNWESIVDRMLQSPHHAERLAMWWLDAARYSDSDGFQQDATRQNWPWRDWVVNAFRENMPYDQFTVQQFAGDLLPDATPEQILATCFHRNHMTNGEGGRDPEESRVDYVIDRVNTTGTVWLGLTLGCVQCHSHKFDPITHQDYYSLTAFFNSIDEDGKAGMNAKPYLKYESPLVEPRIAEMQAFVDQLRQTEKLELQTATERFETWLNEWFANPVESYQAWWTPEPNVVSSNGSKFNIESDAIVQSIGPTPSQDDYRIELTVPESMRQISGWRLEVFPYESHVDGKFSLDPKGNGDFTLTSVRTLLRPVGAQAESELEIAAAVADYEADKKRETKWDDRYATIEKTLNDDARDGWTTEGAKEIAPHVGVYRLEQPHAVQPGDRVVLLLRQFSTHGHANIGRFRVSLASEPGDTVSRVDGGSPIKSLIDSQASDRESIDKELRAELLKQFLLSDDVYQEVRQRLTRAEKQLSSLKSEAKPRSVMVLEQRTDPRDTHVLLRGVWDAQGEKVQPSGLPAVLDWPAEKWPAEKTQTRLDLANWIVDRQNPLTARVAVNHLWQMLFGNGLVRTPDDFGLQGELPTHPKLLDWLAVELMENDWDLRHIIRLIVTSETYRQSSNTTPELLELDPENRLLARAPRFRLPAWMIRDNALQVSGLLNPALGGPPVHPYQPSGVWAEITMGRFHYDPSLGPAQYRRTLYAYWRRSSAPTFLFDSAQRRVCEVNVRRTNTPLHALTLMNDTTMLEASRVLADWVLSDLSQSNEENQLAALSERVLSRRLSADEISEIQDVLADARRYYQSDLVAAFQFTKIGQQPAAPESTVVQTAAWMTIASLLLNLDEAISHE